MEDQPAACFTLDMQCWQLTSQSVEQELKAYTGYENLLCMRQAIQIRIVQLNFHNALLDGASGFSR